MGRIATIDPRLSMEDLFYEYLWTLVRLLASPDADVKALAKDFQEFEKDWWDTLQKEMGFVRALFIAQALVESLDGLLDTLSDLVAATARVEDKSSPGFSLVTLLYGTQIPSIFRRPTLGAQLQAMSNWPNVLKATSNATLQGYGTQIEALVTEANAAAETERQADKALEQFRAMGDRRALVDKLNALRKSTHGALGKIGHEKKYPNGFAETFFRREAAVREPSIEELDKKIVIAEAEVKRLQAKRAELATAQENDAKARKAADRASKQAAFEQAEKTAKESADRAAALKAELEKMDDDS
jgi:hypothetical protein